MIMSVTIAFALVAGTLLGADGVHQDLRAIPAVSGDDDQLCGCGQANHFRIVGGSEALPNEFPWMVYLYGDSLNSTFMCSGFLVSDRHVITAAHCVKDRVNDDIHVVLGDHDRNSSEDGDAMRVRPERIAIHPRYNRPRRNDNDVAVVTLSRRASIGYAIRPLCLPDFTIAYNYSSGLAVIAGWGKIGVEFGDPASDVLRCARVSIVDDADCRRAYDEISVPITDRMLCAGSPQDTADSCQGDSGGPLMVRDASGRYMAAGIASFGFGCASPSFPGVYTKVDRMHDFIAAHTVVPPSCR